MATNRIDRLGSVTSILRTDADKLGESGETTATSSSTTGGAVDAAVAKAVQSVVAALPVGPMPLAPQLLGVNLRSELPSTNKSMLSGRFAGVSQLEAVLAGTAVLRNGSSGAHVKLVQETLMDLGFGLPSGADGTWGLETSLAVKRFQAEAGLPQRGVVDAATMRALNAVAPPAGMQLERNPEYDAIYADNRVDITLATGETDNWLSNWTTLFKTRRKLKAAGFSALQVERLSADERERLGLGPDRYAAGPRYFRKTWTDPATGQELNAIVRLITPSSADTPQQVVAMVRQGLEQDEVFLYNGHARYGTGPDFDGIDEGEGNFVIDGEGNQVGDLPPDHLLAAIREHGDTDLDELHAKPAYQLAFFHACTSETYLKHLRDQNVFAGRTRENTDILVSTMPLLVSGGAEEVVSAIRGICAKKSMNDINAEISDIESRLLSSSGDEAGAKRARTALLESGFLHNHNNRHVPKRTP